MNQFIKQFFGPSWKSAIIKIVLGILLFYLVTIIHSLTWNTVGHYETGWPLAYEKFSGPVEMFGYNYYYISNSFAKVFDIVFWYLVVCLIGFSYQKIKRR